MKTGALAVRIVGPLLLVAFLPGPVGAQSGTLSEAERALYDQLSSGKLHEFRGQTDLAEYMRLRQLALNHQLPAPAQDVAHYARMSLGQPYRRRAYDRDLSEADCVTFTERCIALGCTDNWAAAYKLQGRLRYKDGSGRTADLNREPILDWIPNNAWLFDEVTAQLGTPLSTFDLVFENRVQQVAYVAKQDLPAAYPRLETGDVLFIIADSPNPPSDPAWRTRCVHMAIIYKHDLKVDILQSYPPAASQWRLEHFMRNPYFRGGLFVRLRPGASELVAAELTRMAGRFQASPADIDNICRMRREQFAFVTASRPAEETRDIAGIRYGMVQIRPGETLWGLFRGGWKSVSNLGVNQEFMQRHPTLEAEDYQGDWIYYPISRTDGDTTPP